MNIYCAHEYGGKESNVKSAEEKIKKLAFADLENTYISPIHCFSWIKYDEIDYELAMMMCLDLMSKCDKVIVLSNISNGVKWEIEEAERMNIPIEYAEGLNA